MSQRNCVCVIPRDKAYKFVRGCGKAARLRLQRTGAWRGVTSGAGGAQGIAKGALLTPESVISERMPAHWRLLRFLRATREEDDSNENSQTHVSARAAATRGLHVSAAGNCAVVALPRGAIEFSIDNNTSSSNTAGGKTSSAATVVAQAHANGVAHVHALPDATVISLGTDAHATGSLRLWTLHRAHDDTQDSEEEISLKCVSVIRFALDAGAQPTCMDIRVRKSDGHTRESDRLSEITSIAVGFADGSVTEFSGDFLRDRVGRRRYAAAPGEGTAGEERGVVSVWYTGKEDTICLFVVTATSVAVIRNGKRLALDSRGVTRREMCAVIKASQQLVVAREEALYFFTRDGRGACLAFQSEGPTCRVAAVGKYVLHVPAPGNMLVYDVENKVMVHRSKHDVAAVFEDIDGNGLVAPASALVVMHNGDTIRLTEAPLEERVALLLERGLYPAAVTLARAESGPHSALLVRALRAYSEALLSKAEYDAAAAQLVETIPEKTASPSGTETSASALMAPGVEPAWVISRLVEQNGLRSGLRLYLEALHARGQAQFVHTKVLLTCYRHDRARAAILSASASAAEKTTDEHVLSVLADVDWTDLQVDTAVEMCREATLYSVAERLARHRKRHTALAELLLHDLKRPHAVLDLLRSLNGTQAAPVLRACARPLLAQVPSEFVDFLANELCRATALASKGVGTGSSARPAADRPLPVISLFEFLPLFADLPRWRAVLLEKVLARPGCVPPQEVSAAWLVLFESLVCVDVADVDVERFSRSQKTERSVLNVGANAEVDTNMMTNVSVKIQSPLPRVGRRALRILQSRRSMIDNQKALRIAERHGHDPCLEYLYEYLRMYKELGVALRVGGNGDALLRAARRHGEREPTLWLEALRLFAPLAAEEIAGTESATECSDSASAVSAESSDSPEKGKKKRHGEDGTSDERTARDMLGEAINALDRSAALSPVEIVDALTDACPEGSWLIAREYFERTITAVRKQEIQQEHAGLRLDSDLEELRHEVTKLEEKAVFVQPRICSACEDPISVPLLHFFCEHSFHASCLAPSAVSPLRASGISSDIGFTGGITTGAVAGSTASSSGMWTEECPRCAPEQDAVVSMHQAIEEKNSRHDDFFAQLRASRDGFATVIEALERSAFL